MIRENITKVRDVIASLDPKRFEMDRWISKVRSRARTIGGRLNHCGTSACIAGWTLAVLSPNSRADGWDIPAEASHLLGLSNWRGLFIPDNLNYRTQAQAVRVLDILLETGEVDWERAIREVPARVEAV